MIVKSSRFTVHRIQTCWFDWTKAEVCCRSLAFQSLIVNVFFMFSCFFWLYIMVLFFFVVFSKSSPTMIHSWIRSLKKKWKLRTRVFFFPWLGGNSSAQLGLRDYLSYTEAKNHPIEKENIIFQTSIIVFHVNFPRGVPRKLSDVFFVY